MSRPGRVDSYLDRPPEAPARPAAPAGQGALAPPVRSSKVIPGVPTRQRTLTPSRLRRSPSNHSSATAPGLSHPPERGEAPKGGAVWRLLPVPRLSYWLLLRDRNCIYSGCHFPSGQKARFVMGMDSLSRSFNRFPFYLTTPSLRFSLQSFQSSAEPRMPVVVLGCRVRSWGGGRGGPKTTEMRVYQANRESPNF